jgi:hypothetical protein
MKKKAWMKIAAAVLFLAAAIFFVWKMNRIEQYSDQLVFQAAAGICIACALFCVFGEEGAEQVRKLAKKCREILSGLLGNVIQAVARFFGMHHGKTYSGPGIIREYQDTAVRISRKERKRRYQQKPYRDMDNRERVRYWYGRFLKKQIQKGYRFRPSATPGETGQELLEQKRMTEQNIGIFDRYNEARYHTHAEITEEMVEMMRKNTNLKKFKKKS